MHGVVPGEEGLAVCPGVLDGAESIGELGSVFEGFKLGFGIRNMWRATYSRGFFASGGDVAGERSGTALIAAPGGKESSAIWKYFHNRKNFLFVASERGGRAAAVAYSLIETAKLQRVEPFAYLTHLLPRLPNHPVNRLHELLPGFRGPLPRMR